jgi:hypothetical protein
MTTAYIGCGGGGDAAGENGRALALGGRTNSGSAAAAFVPATRGSVPVSFPAATVNASADAAWAAALLAAPLRNDGVNDGASPRSDPVTGGDDAAAPPSLCGFRPGDRRGDQLGMLDMMFLGGIRCACRCGVPGARRSFECCVCSCLIRLAFHVVFLVVS